MQDIDNVELNSRTITKAVISLVSGACASYVVKEIVNNNITITNRRQSVAVWVGRSVIASTVALAASRNVEKQVDEAFDAIDRIKASIEDPAGN